MSCVDYLDVVAASEIALDDCHKATELYPGQTLCLPMEAFPLRRLGTQYCLVSVSVVAAMVRGEVTRNSYKVETCAPGCCCFSY